MDAVVVMARLKHVSSTFLAWYEASVNDPSGLGHMTVDILGKATFHVRAKPTYQEV